TVRAILRTKVITRRKRVRIRRPGRRLRLRRGRLRRVVLDPAVPTGAVAVGHARQRAPDRPPARPGLPGDRDCTRLVADNKHDVPRSTTCARTTTPNGIAGLQLAL